MATISTYVDIDVDSVIDQIDDERLLAEIARRGVVALKHFDVAATLAELSAAIRDGRRTDALTLIDRITMPKFKTRAEGVRGLDAPDPSPPAMRPPMSIATSVDALFRSPQATRLIQFVAHVGDVSAALDAEGADSGLASSPLARATRAYWCYAQALLMQTDAQLPGKALAVGFGQADPADTPGLQSARDRAVDVLHARLDAYEATTAAPLQPAQAQA